MSYLLHSKEVKYGILIDCGEFVTVREVINELGITIKAVLLTHGHSDHIMGLEELLKEYPNTEIYAHKEGHEELQDSRKNFSFYHGMPFSMINYSAVVVNDGEIFKFEGLTDIEILYTPGHDSSCITYKAERHLFTGDAYIPGIEVYTKLPRGNNEQALASTVRLVAMEKGGFLIHCGHHSYNKNNYNIN